MTQLCQITGDIKTPEGVPVVATIVSFTRVGRAVGIGERTVVPSRVEVQTTGLGELSVSLFPGAYVAEVNSPTIPSAQRRFAVGVPEQASASLRDLIEQAPPLTPSLVAQVLAVTGAYASRADAEAAQVPAAVQQIAVVHAGMALRYRRDGSGTALTTGDGAAWSPADEVRPEHWGAVSNGTANDRPRINSAINYAHDQGGGVVLLRPERTYSVGDAVVLKSGVTLRGDGGLAVVRLADGADSQILRTDNFTAQKADGSAGITRGVGIIDVLFSGNRANNPAGEGVFLAESGGYFQNVHIDDFAGTGFERAGFRAVDFADNGSGNFPISPFVRRVETLINDLFVWRSGSASAPAVLMSGPGDLRCGHLFFGGNDGKVIFDCDSADYGYVHLYANGAAHDGDYANEIVTSASFSMLEVRDCDWSGVKIASDEVQIGKLYATKNGRVVDDGTGRQVLIEGNRCSIADAYIAAKVQANGSLPGDGSMPLIEIAGNQNTVRGTLTGNIGAERRAVAGLIHTSGIQNRIDLMVFGVDGPAVRFTAGTQCDIKASVSTCNVGLEKNGPNISGSFDVYGPSASVGTMVTGSDSPLVRVTERWHALAGGISQTAPKLISEDLPGDAVGTGFLSLPHGLLAQPALGDMQVSITRGTTGAFPGDAQIEAYIESRDPTNVYVRWRVRTASATAGLLFRVAVWVRIGM